MVKPIPLIAPEMYGESSETADQAAELSVRWQEAGQKAGQMRQGLW